MFHRKAARIAGPLLACSLRRNGPVPDRNDTRIHVTHSKEARVRFMKSKSGGVQARHLPGASLAALLLLSSPALAGPPFITDDPEPTDYLHWELYTFSQGMSATGEISGVVPPSCNQACGEHERPTFVAEPSCVGHPIAERRAQGLGE
jgi:hypothetical protein